MAARVSRLASKEGVPTDRDALIVEREQQAEGAAIRIVYRDASNAGEDRVVFERYPCCGVYALKLAMDLAYLCDCDTVVVIGKLLPASLPKPPPRVREP